MHLDSFKRASARTHVLCAVPILYCALLHGMESLQGQGSMMTQSPYPTPNSNMIPRVSHSSGRRQFLEEVTVSSLSPNSKGLGRVGMGWSARHSSLWGEWTDLENGHVDRGVHTPAQRVSWAARSQLPLHVHVPVQNLEGSENPDFF